METNTQQENKYLLKCDICKRTLKENISFKESVEGSVCLNCKY